MLPSLHNLKLGEKARRDPAWGDPVEALRANRVKVSPSAVLAMRAAAGSPIVRAALLDRLESGADDHRPAAAEALAGIAADPEVGRRLRVALDDTSPELRAAAARALAATLGQPDQHDVTFGLLSRRLADPMAGVRLATLGVLAPWRERHPTLERPLRALLGDPSSRVRRAAIQALAPGLDAAALAPLVDDKSAKVACTAAAMVRAGDADWWWQALAAPDPARRRAAAARLPPAIARDARIRPLYLRALADEEADQRAAALAGAAPLVADDLEVRAAVLAALADDDLAVRVAAVMALRGVAVRCLRDLARLLQGDRLPVRLAVLEILLAAPRKASVPMLLDRQLPDALRIDVDDPARLADKEQVDRVRAGLGAFAAPRLRRDHHFGDFLLGQLESASMAARIGAACVVAEWPGRPAEIDELLVAVLDDSRDDASLPRRLTGAAQIVVARQPQLAEARDLALGALDYGLRPWDELMGSPVVRRLASRILGALPAFDEYAFTRLLQVLHRDGDPEVRAGAAQALVSLARRRLEGGELPEGKG